jgi:hypothetical protein
VDGLDRHIEGLYEIHTENLKERYHLGGLGIDGQRGSMWPQGHTSFWGMCTIKTWVMASIPTKSDACTSMS